MSVAESCHSKCLLLALALFLAPASQSDGQERVGAQSFAVTNVSVIPMDENRLLENQTVIVKDGVIESVSDADIALVPDQMTRIDGRGRYLMPGLADLHIHLRNEDELVSYLAWGVTTVMHLGGSGQSGPQQLEYRRNIRNGSLLGPNIYTTGRILDGDPALPRSAYSLTTDEEARSAVQELKASGFDFVKIYNNVSLPVFTAIVDEARKQDLAVVGHIPRGFDPLLALGGGQNAVAHMEELFFTYFQGPRSTEDMPRDYAPDLDRLPKLVEVLVSNDVAVMPDLSFTFTNMLMWDDLEILWGDPEYPYLQPATASMWQAGNINRRSEIGNFIVREQWKYDLMQTLTLEFQKAGLLQVIGTDTSLPGLFPGKAVHRELTELVKAGVSNFDALAIGSRNAGEFVRKFIDADARFGQVTAGYRADLILLTKNPLEDVRHARSVVAVSVNGRFIEQSQLDERRTTLRERYAMLFAVNDQVDAALNSDAAQATLEQLISIHLDDSEIQDTIEGRVTSLGYAASFADDLARARVILELNTRLFPNSANTWDSYAEIVLYMGERELALKLYRKALEVDPGFTNAADNIEKILKDGGQQN